MSKAKPTHMRPILEAAIASGELTFSTRKASRWALVTIDDLTARLAAAEAALNDERISRAAAYIALRAIRIDLVAWVLRHMDEFGWISSDCQHDLNNEFFESIVQQYEEDEAAKGGRE